PRRRVSTLPLRLFVTESKTQSRHHVLDSPRNPKTRGEAGTPPRPVSTHRLRGAHPTRGTGARTAPHPPPARPSRSARTSRGGETPRSTGHQEAAVSQHAPESVVVPLVSVLDVPVEDH